MAAKPPSLPGYAAHVYPVDAIRATGGANVGDAIATATAVSLGDTYQLRSDTPALRLMLNPAGSGASQRVAAGSGIGHPGDQVRLLSLLTLMAPDGDQVEILLLALAGGTHLALPLSPIAPRVDYALIAARDDPGNVRITDIVCVSFAAGTLITRPGGTQTPIERLGPGDLVLTRDNGPQPVRWIGRATFRAIGGFAPVVISQGTLGNGQDLIVSPHHRVFIYQRGPHRIAGTPEIMVQAKHLVEGNRVRRREGGFVDYLSLVFDRHEIIYAEGIPAESLMVTEATLRVLPEALAEEVRALFPGLTHRPHYGTEIGRETLDAAGRDVLFRPFAGS